jgi:hypothetical protein
MFLAGFFGFFAVGDVVLRLFFRTVNQGAAFSFLFVLFGGLGLSFGLGGRFRRFDEIVFDGFDFAGSDTGWDAGSGQSRGLELAFSCQLYFQQVVKRSRVIVSIVDDVSPRLNRVHVVPLHQSDNLFAGLNLVLSYNDTLRLVPVTRPSVPLALPNLVYFETRFWVHVQNVPQNVFCVD